MNLQEYRKSARTISGCCLQFLCYYLVTVRAQTAVSAPKFKQIFIIIEYRRNYFIQLSVSHFVLFTLYLGARRQTLVLLLLRHLHSQLFQPDRSFTWSKSLLLI